MVSETITTNLDLADYFIENLDAYYSEPWAEDCVKKAITHYSVASKVLHSGDLEWASAPWFEDIKSKAKITVEENSGHGTEKFKEKDPYEYDQWRFDARRAHVASALLEIMRGQTDQEKLKELGINNKEIPALLEKVNEIVDDLYKDFLENIRSNQNISEEDKQNLLNPDSSSVKRSSLIDNVRSFVARFITQGYYQGGYTGTIPEQIMRVMDFDDEDIERRIRLLSAPSVHRRVKGIPENAREEIIEYIEHNAKLEETAEGLIIDEKTGKIRHIAKPTSPEEQFYFMMVKQAVARHYWLQEQLHHEPSGNINLDSEHYTIRIRQEYAKLLPEEFINNPKEFFSQHGELLKGSKGEGEYPDEEVVLFRLSDGTEIVAKKIELRKAKEARREFSILIAAKKANLPTAEPVGFLSGKEEPDGSYLLMKKLEGRSGRKFEKELKASGKYSDEQIKNILKQVSDKHKEMVDLFRTTLKIDKRWRIKDTIIEFNEETGEVESVIPIDWERAQNYNSSTPKEIDEIS